MVHKAAQIKLHRWAGENSCPGWPRQFSTTVVSSRRMTDTTHVDHRVLPVPESHRLRAATLIAKLGNRRAAKKLGVSKDTALRVAAGFPVMPGTIALLERSEQPTPQDAA
jgi:hypothetical protein